MSGSGKRTRELTDEELTLWRGVAQSIRPLGRPPAKTTGAAATAEAGSGGRNGKAKPARTVARTKPSPAPAPVAPPKPLASLDRRTRQKLARGREPIEARLDLHGLTQSEAHAALTRFLRRAQGDDQRFVLIVTGKGARGDGGERGVLRRRVPQWLAMPEMRDTVLGFETAHAGHGGDGALYVRIRKRRSYR